jgi:hypothetical protein
MRPLALLPPWLWSNKSKKIYHEQWCFEICGEKWFVIFSIVKDKLLLKNYGFIKILKIDIKGMEYTFVSSEESTQITSTNNKITRPNRRRWLLLNRPVHDMENLGLWTKVSSSSTFGAIVWLFNNSWTCLNESLPV